MPAPTPIVAVAGNHEHYRGFLPEQLAAGRLRAAEQGIAFLEDAEAVIAGVRFLGCTLRTDFALRGAAWQASARLNADDLTARGILNKFGAPWRKRTIVSLLQNRLYRGDLTHAGEVSPGIHEAIVTERAWQAVQDALGASARRRGALVRAPVPALLKGLLFGPGGQALIHTFVQRPKGTYRYYVLSGDHRYGRHSDAGWRFRARDLERSVVDAVRELVPPPARSWSEAEAAGVARSLVARIDIGVDDAVVLLTPGARRRIPVPARIGLNPPRQRSLA